MQIQNQWKILNKENSNIFNEVHSLLFVYVMQFIFYLSHFPHCSNEHFGPLRQVLLWGIADISFQLLEEVFCPLVPKRWTDWKGPGISCIGHYKQMKMKEFESWFAFQRTSLELTLAWTSNSDIPMSRPFLAAAIQSFSVLVAHGCLQRGQVIHYVSCIKPKSKNFISHLHLVIKASISIKAARNWWGWLNLGSSL